jgi:hypothetical protein
MKLVAEVDGYVKELLIYSAAGVIQNGQAKNMSRRHRNS